MTWGVILLEEVHDWFMDLDADSAGAVARALEVLERVGPSLGRPLADRIIGSQHQNMKELRPSSPGSTAIRILFAFDPARNAILLVAGDKAGAWQSWYRTSIKIADERFTEWLNGEREMEI